VDRNKREIRAVNRALKKTSNAVTGIHGDTIKRISDLEKKIPEKINRMPHFWMSIVKSLLRIFACYQLLSSNIVVFAIFLIIAEVIGIIEEMVDV